MAITDIRNFVAVDERLATAGQPTEDQLRDVAADGYAAVVNLGLLDPKYCLADEAGLVRSLGMAYRHIPVRFDAPTLEDFRAFVEAMDERAGAKTFVHCAANYRVSAFVSLYGELRLGWSRDRADRLARRVWSPDETWLAFIERCRAERAP
ncbi:MAG TPA: protein tyrosine phosphatase family protein [Polyangia bacterium]|nr:protein tyrosine phosphatase family protein [Polyangia bacterium]